MSKKRKIQDLLQEGLDHYGEGRTAEAERCWSEVLFLDPDNAEAREYLESARDEDMPAPKHPVIHGDELGDLVQDAQRMLRDGHLEAALELFETVARRDPDRLEVQGYVEMVRSKLLARYRDQLGDLDARPTVLLGRDEVLKYNLPATAGFLLSLVDGNTSVNDLVSLSGLDTFEALRVLAGLLDSGIVGKPG